MVNKTLLDYIQQQIRNGYDVNIIKNHLLRYGYSESDVDEAIRYMHNPEMRHVIHFSMTTMATIIAMFLGIVAVTFLFINLSSSKNPEMLLDLNLDPVKTTIAAGEKVTFISEIDNLGSAVRYDVNIKYEIYNIKTSAIITFKEETRAIETKGSKQIEIEVPSDAAAGNYVLRAIAKYDSYRAIATLPVVIKKGVEEQVEEPVEEPIVEEPVEEPLVEEPVEENPLVKDALTTFETLEKIEEIATSNRRKAEKLCKDLGLQTSRDICYNKLAEVLGDEVYCGKVIDERTSDVCLSNVANLVDKNEICEEISKDSRKDTCYMNFVLPPKKNYDVCDKVINQYLRQSCESLKQLNKLNITDIAFYESLINQSFIQLI